MADIPEDETQFSDIIRPSRAFSGLDTFPLTRGRGFFKAPKSPVKRRWTVGTQEKSREVQKRTGKWYSDRKLAHFAQGRG